MRDRELRRMEDMYFVACLYSVPPHAAKARDPPPTECPSTLLLYGLRTKLGTDSGRTMYEWGGERG